jgi:hypothetical protein
MIVDLRKSENKTQGISTQLLIQISVNKLKTAKPYLDVNEKHLGFNIIYDNDDFYLECVGKFLYRRLRW